MAVCSRFKFIINIERSLGDFLWRKPQKSSFIEVCHRTDPKVKECVIHNAVDIIRPRLAKGIPEMYIPSFDPLYIPEVTLSGGEGITATFTDLELYNASNFILEDAQYNWDDLSVALKVYFPQITIPAKYKIKGRILVLDLDGSGTCVGTYSDVRGVINGHATAYLKKGRTFLKLHRDKLDLTIGKAHLEFNNLFGDNKELNDRTNALLNENIQEIIKEVKPIVIEVISTFAFGILDRLYEKFSFDDLFPNP